MNRKYLILFIVLFAGYLPHVVYSQGFNLYDVVFGGFVTNNKSPFWLRANQYGTIPISGGNIALNASFSKEYRDLDSTIRKSKWDWGYSLKTVFNTNASGVSPQAFASTTALIIPEMYVKTKFGKLEFYIGRRREIVGLVDTLLTTGAYSWSGNALPIPKMQIGFADYTPIPFTNNVVSILGILSHGWFEHNNKIIEGSFLHQSYVYGRIGKPEWRARFYAGINHEAVWGGYSTIQSPSIPSDGRLPSSFGAFANVFLGIRGDLGNDAFKTQNNFEGNRIGNHLGSVDIATDVNIKNWNVFLYRQFPYDDGSLFYGTNLKDGLNGIRFKKKKVSRKKIELNQITLEYLYTGSQGGDEFVLDDPKRRGRDNYFNNSQFVDGWTYFGRTIGNPFLTYWNETVAQLPSEKPIANNRVSVYHLGLSTTLFYRVNVSVKASYSLNAGTYNIPYINIPKQFSGILIASVPIRLLGGITAAGSVAVDAGELLPNSVGGSLSLRKSGFLGGKKTDYQRSSPFRMP